LRAYALQQIRLALPATKESSVTRRQTLKQVQKATGKKHPELKPLALPETIAHLWIWYNDVKTKEPLTCQELIAWTEVTGNCPTPFEFDLIRMLDVLYWETVKQ
jgi:hypothetical protein